MALLSKASVALLLAVTAVLAAPASAQTTHETCVKNKKITVQNLCAHPVTVEEQPLAASVPLFATSKHTLKPHTHEEFPVCWWTGRLIADGDVKAEFHVGVDGGSFYMGPNTRKDGQSVPVIISPHGAPLEGQCPAVGCPVQGRCSAAQVPGGKCSHVQEIKVIYCSPGV